MKKKLLSLFALSCVLSANNLDFALVQDVIPNTKIVGVKKAYSNLYAVCQANGEVLYVNAYDKLVLWGSVWTNRGANLTEKDTTWCELLLSPKIKDFKELDIDKVKELKEFGLKTVNGKGSKIEFIVFTSPHCPYCKDFKKAMQAKNMTIYEYMSPSSESENIYKEAGVKDPKDLLLKQVEITKDFGVKPVPLILIVENNKVIDFIVGYASDSPQNTKTEEYLNKND